MHDFPQPVAIHRVKGFRQYHEGSVEVSPHLLTLLLQLASGEDHVNCFSVSSEATLAFREQSLLQVSVQAIEENAGIPLDFLSFARHPGILHLPQPLLYKAATSVEGCLICSSRASDVGFEQLVLLGKQSVDSSVVVIEPVSVQTTYAAEDIQGGGLDGVTQLTPAVLHRDVHVGDWKTKPHLGDDEAVIRLSVGTGDCLCHQHVLFISPSEENILQEVPVSQPEVYPGRLLPHREANEGVNQQETVFRKGSQKEAVIVTATETIGTQHSLQGSAACPDAGVEVTKDNLLVRLRHSHQQGVQFIVEFVPRRIRTRHWVSVSSDDGGENVSLKRQAEAHQAIIDTLRQTGQTSHDVVSDGKGDTASPRSAFGRSLQKKV
ncbi:unnamed protein product [Schistocephalus solidus]|uniref:Nuclear pore membrane glycoprotein n=1 Tax=Schistocephalus solidus TaxID=70667 RepID=A0A183T7R7_SCHSO|nr:unnamed protein product [Schistocephalus solidus]